jgi:hypothetical protein
MTTRSYSDLSDSATTFDPEEQFDRDIDEGMKGMTKRQDWVDRASMLEMHSKRLRERAAKLEIEAIGYSDCAKQARFMAELPDCELLPEPPQP